MYRGYNVARKYRYHGKICPTYLYITVFSSYIEKWIENHDKWIENHDKVVPAEKKYDTRDYKYVALAVGTCKPICTISTISIDWHRLAIHKLLNQTHRADTAYILRT
jgi:hypothetical protein